MLSPKMQRCVRVNDTQLLMLAERAQYDHSMVINISCYWLKIYNFGYDFLCSMANSKSVTQTIKNGRLDGLFCIR